ncbi:MAG: LysR family transcriptional regulator [Deltaproteobacteria bacterium]|nr:LysR family transcriptional regulator [Deltaproteobacteria bacterium]
MAEQLSFRRAAAEVALTPAALSQRIKLLEELVGCRLFDRSPRHVALTAQGQALLERARVALAALRDCRNIDGATAQTTRMRIGTRFELGISWVVPTLIELRSSRPHWHVDLVFGSGHEILDRLEAGLVDAIITSAPTARAQWVAKLLHPEHYVFVAAPQTVRDQPLETPEQAAEHVLVDINGDLPLTRYLMTVCPGLGFADVWRVGTTAAVHQLVLAGQGVAVLPRHVVADDLEGGRLVRLLPEVEPLSDSFRLLYRATSPLAPVLDEFAQQLRERPLQ